MNWQPIETAPKNGGRILLGYETGFYEGEITVICGWWTDDKYTSTPLPHWTIDMNLGIRKTKAIQPKWWMPLPKLPTD